MASPSGAGSGSKRPHRAAKQRASVEGAYTDQLVLRGYEVRVVSQQQRDE